MREQRLANPEVLFELQIKMADNLNDSTTTHKSLGGHFKQT